MTKRVIMQIDAPDGGKPIQVLEGRYGPYVTDGETNASIPKGTDPKTVSLEAARELIDARAGAPPREKRGGRFDGKGRAARGARAGVRPEAARGARPESGRAAAVEAAAAPPAKRRKAPAAVAKTSKPKARARKTVH